MPAVEAPELRSATLQKLKAIAQADHANWSQALVHRFKKADFWNRLPARRGLLVALYRSMKSEPAIEPLAAWLQSEGCRLVYPRITGGKMEFVDAEGFEWEKTSIGVLQPSVKAPICKASDLDLIVVPGVVFGVRGERLGRGAGHYDRFLPQANRAFKAAPCFELQIAASVPQNPWDQKMDVVITERRELTPGQPG